MAESIALGMRLATADELATVAGIEGEISVTEGEWRAVVHDGVTKGGYPLAKLAEAGYSLTKSEDGTKLQLKNKNGVVLSETDAPAGFGGSGVHVGNEAPTDENTDVWIDLDEESVGNDYTLPTATSSTLGGVTIGSNISVSNGKISLTSSNVTSALGFTPLSTSGTAAKATADASGNTISSTYAKLASPTFTGTPTAPTATAGTNTTQIATTAFVQNAVSSSGSGIPKTGNRGTLAGYGVPSVAEGFTFTVNKDSPDFLAQGGTDAIVINVDNETVDGGVCYTKVVYLITYGGLTVNLGSNWNWAGGVAPSFKTIGYLVLHLNGKGVASYIPVA